MPTIINLKQARKWLIKKSLYEFVLEMWDSYETSPFSDCWLIEYLCECYQYSIRHFLPQYVWGEWVDDKTYELLKKESGGGCAIRDMLLPNGEHTHNHDFNVAPRHCKSSILNVLGPAWTIINTPVTVASVSHSLQLSGEMVEKKQKLFNSDKYKYYFGDDISLRLAKNSATLLQLRNGGRTYSVAMDHFTGFGADIILNDDLISVADARRNGAVLLHARDYFKTTMPSRLNNKSSGVVWHIMQRIGRGDISDLIAEDKGLQKIYSHTEIQAVADKEQTLIFPCSGKIKEIHKGDLLWPERFGDYTSLKMEIGSEDFTTQYNQEPSESRLNVIKDDMIHWMDDDKEVQEFVDLSEFHYNSHDCPVKDKETSDFHGYGEGYSKANELLITDASESHMGYVAEKDFISKLQLIDPASIQIIEDKANGAALAQDLKKDVPGIVTFDPGTRSKTQRLELASTYMSKGLVRFARNEHTEYLVQQLKKFPLLEHDDIVDAFSQMVIYHFTQRQLGVYTGAFSYQNVVEDSEVNKTKFLTYGATINGDIIKVLAVQQDSYTDTYTVTEEHLFRSLQAFEEFCKKVLPGNMIYDCSPQNRLRNLLTEVYNVVKFEEKDRDNSISILKTGFYKKKVLICKSCKQTVNDVARLRVTGQSRDKGIDQTETLDEGFAGCLRAVITMFKGYSQLWY